MFALLATRMAMFVMTSPFPGAHVPKEIRVGIALLFAVAATPLAGSCHIAFGPELVLAVLAEAMTGAAIGFIFRVGMSVADVLGSTWAHAMGLTFASSYDPAQSTTTDTLSRIVSYAAMLVALAMGAHRVALGVVIASVRLVPVGHALDVGTLLPGVLRWVSRTIECGLGLAVPAMTVSVVVQVALGLVARAAPSLQIFSVGLAVSLASGALVILTGLGDSLGGLGAHLMNLNLVFERLIALGR